LDTWVSMEGVADDAFAMRKPDRGSYVGNLGS
jgi:hypothetical protein